MPECHRTGQCIELPVGVELRWPKRCVVCHEPCDEFDTTIPPDNDLDIRRPWRRCPEPPQAIRIHSACVRPLQDARTQEQAHTIVALIPAFLIGFVACIRLADTFWQWFLADMVALVVCILIFGLLRLFARRRFIYNYDARQQTWTFYFLDAEYAREMEALNRDDASPDVDFGPLELRSRVDSPDAAGATVPGIRTVRARPPRSRA